MCDAMMRTRRYSRYYLIISVFAICMIDQRVCRFVVTSGGVVLNLFQGFASKHEFESYVWVSFGDSPRIYEWSFCHVKLASLIWGSLDLLDEL